MNDKIKILFCGDVEGRFDALFKRVENINNKSGPFDVLLCVGNFFGVNNTEFNKYRIGEKKVPIQTYILGPNKKEHVDLYPNDESDYELCQNVYFLGKRGLYNDNKGLKIAYLSGTCSKETVEPWTYNEKDVSELCDICIKGNPSFRGVDILLTSQWATDIIENGKALTASLTSDVLGYVCMRLKPRYFVSGLEGIYYERAPFRCPNLGDHDTTLESVTRFIGLARVGNPKKEKWIYALSVTPFEKMKISELVQKTTDETACPFDFYDLENKVHKNKRKASGPNQYFYDMNAPSDDLLNKNKKKTKRSKIEFDQSKCWFCLASPSVEKHLVVTVGNHCYLALAKGGIVEEHLLICPIEHYQSTLTLPSEVSEELQEFKEAIKSFYDRDGRVAVFFERNYKTSHMQLQAIPIPRNATRELKEIFLEEADLQGFKLETLETHNRLDQVLPTKTPYFTVELPDQTILYAKIQGSQNFPLNFAREVLAAGPVLNLTSRIEWKDCILQKDEEVSLVERIRTDFEPFDFTT